MQRFGAADAVELPGGDVAEVVVVAEGFAVGILVFFAKVAAAALVAVECVGNE